MTRLHQAKRSFSTILVTRGYRHDWRHKHDYRRVNMRRATRIKTVRAKPWVTALACGILFSRCVLCSSTLEVTAANAQSPVSTATPTAVRCIGDCGNSGQVTVDEILTMVNIALGNASVSECETGDTDGHGQITVDEILAAVNNALTGCVTLTPEEACIASGGSVSTDLCCASVGNFPNTCSIGPCGCSPASSHEVQVCLCGTGKCFAEASLGCVTR